MKVFFSVGEPSGDLHGGNLIRELRLLDGGLQAVGYGGPRMQAAGAELLEDLTQLAVMGFAPVVAHIPKFWRLLRAADRYFAEQRPDAVVLIDYPGFNWWIARRAKRHGIPVFYYGVPQLWAWASWRVGKMRRLVDHALCKLPFEEKWYRERGCNAQFVGHPYFDELDDQRLDSEFIERLSETPGPLVTILPGSRTQEIYGNMPCFVRAARIIHRKVPDVRFAVACFKDKHIAIVQDAIAGSNVSIEVFVDRTPELIHAAVCCMACSGSVSLELLYHRKPTVIHYRLSRLISWLAYSMRLVKVRLITLVNLLAVEDGFDLSKGRFDPSSPDADQIPFPEYPTSQDKSTEVAAHIIEWLTDDNRRQAKIDQLSAIRAQIAYGGASRRAAAYINRHLSLDAAVPQPHFDAKSNTNSGTDIVESKVRR